MGVVAAVRLAASTGDGSRVSGVGIAHRLSQYFRASVDAGRTYLRHCWSLRRDADPEHWLDDETEHLLPYNSSGGRVSACQSRTAANAGVFSLQAGIDIVPHQRAKLERLCRYEICPPTTQEALTLP